MLIIGLLGFAASVLIGRSITDRAFRNLGMAEQMRAADLFADERRWETLAAIVYIVLYLVAVNQHFFNQRLAAGAVVLLWAVWILARAVYHHRNLRNLDFSAEFIRRLVYSSIVQIIGVLWLFVFLFLN